MIGMTDWLERWHKAERRPHQQEATSPFDTFDAIGRKNLRRLGVPDYFLLIARIGPDRVRRVPASAIPEEGVDEAGPFSFVRCPCGQGPVARLAIEKCSGCDRSYVHIDVGSVYVIYGAMTPPPLRASQAVSAAPQAAR